MFTVSLGEYELSCQDGELPELLPEYTTRAALSEQIDLSESYGRPSFLALTKRGDGWPFLVVAQRYQPAGNGWYPGVLLVPETAVLFVGAGERLLAFDLANPRRLWEDRAECGFFRWSRYGEFVLVSAELELAAWRSDGRKLWTTFADPPWEYGVRGNEVTLSDGSRRVSFDIHSGPA